VDEFALVEVVPAEVTLDRLLGYLAVLAVASAEGVGVRHDTRRY
jgi:hypothetical protein